MFINTNGTLYSLSRDAFLYTEEGKVEFNYNDKTLIINSAFAGMISSRQQIAYDMGCNLAVALAWIGIVLTNTVLFAKTYRVYKVTLFRRNQTIKPRNVLGPYIMSVVFSATVLIALTVTSPIHYSTMIKYIFTNGSSQYYNQCYDVNKINGAMFAFNIIIELGILVLAWKVRNTNEELGESRKIFILIILLIALDIVMVVVCSLILWKFFRIISIVLVLKSLLPIWFLICPRMYYVWYENKHGHLPQSVIVPGMGHVTVAGTDNITNPPPTPIIIKNNNDNNSV